MVLHELATNAAKYGALSNGHGQVSVRWRRPARGRSSGKLVLEWRETGGPPIDTPTSTRYGTSGVCGLLPHQPRGAGGYHLPRDGGPRPVGITAASVLSCAVESPPRRPPLA